jgi:hypothetical protein
MIDPPGLGQYSNTASIWHDHGKAVAGALHYLPSLFDRPPCNIAEKLTSGYKAWSFFCTCMA